MSGASKVIAKKQCMRGILNSQGARDSSAERLEFGSCMDDRKLAALDNRSRRSLPKNFSSLLVKNRSIERSVLEFSAVKSCNRLINS